MLKNSVLWRKRSINLFARLELFSGGSFMDIVELAEEDDVVAVDTGDGKCHALVDWKGLHVVPNPTFIDEVCRNPHDAWLNRTNRAERMRKKGFLKAAEELQNEADFIKRTFLCSKSRTNSKPRRGKTRKQKS